MSKLQAFHLALPVNDLDVAKKFYCDVIGCELGRSSDCWIDFNMFGNQFVTHLAEDYKITFAENSVDKKQVPVPHFGVILEWDSWHRFAEKLKAHDVEFIMEPTTRFKEKRGEQATMFIRDPFGYALEFKSFKDISMLFEK